MHARTERRQDAQAPVADLVAETLDDNGAVGRNGPGRGRLLVEEGHQILRSAFVEQVLLLQPLYRSLVAQRHEFARSAADRLAELVRPTDALALPKRDRARNARRR